MGWGCVDKALPHRVWWIKRTGSELGQVLDRAQAKNWREWFDGAVLWGGGESSATVLTESAAPTAEKGTMMASNLAATRTSSAFLGQNTCNRGVACARAARGNRLLSV